VISTDGVFVFGINGADKRPAKTGTTVEMSDGATISTIDFSNPTAIDIHAVIAVGRAKVRQAGFQSFDPVNNPIVQGLADAVVVGRAGTMGDLLVHLFTNAGPTLMFRPDVKVRRSVIYVPAGGANLWIGDINVQVGAGIQIPAGTFYTVPDFCGALYGISDGANIDNVMVTQWIFSGLFMPLIPAAPQAHYG
jgi:hypothetical protein